MPWQDIERKLFALYINAGSTDDEWKLAAEKLRKLLQRRDATVNELTTAGTPAPAVNIAERADYGLFRMPWGRCQGEMLADIDLAYLMSALKWLQRLKDRGDLNGRNALVYEALRKYLNL